MVDYAGNLGRQLQLIGTWDGKPLEQGFQTTAGKVTKAAGVMANKTSTLVNKKMGMAMSQFNEKTEKGRQLLTTFGGAVGGAAGNVVYYAGTLSYVVGRFSLWELAIMGVIAAVGGLVWALLRESEEEKAWQSRMETSKKAMDDLVESTEDFLRTRKQALEGWSQEEIRIEKVNEQMENNHDNMVKAIADLEKWEDTAPAREVLEKQYPSHLVEAYWQSLLGMGTALKLSTELHEADAATKEAAYEKELKRQKDREDKEGKGKKGRALTGEDFATWIEQENERLDRLERLDDERLDRAADKHLRMLAQMAEDEKRLKQKIKDEEIQQQDMHLSRMLDMQIDYAEEIQAKEEAIIRTKEEALNETVSNAIDIFEEMGSLLASSEEANTAVKIAAIIARAGWRMSEEIAEGVAASVTNPIVAASHFTAAALFAAIAAGEVAGAAGGGGGGGTTPSGRSAWQDRGESPWSGEQRETTIIIQLGGREVGRAIHEEYEGYEDRLHPNRTRNRVGY